MGPYKYIDMSRIDPAWARKHRFTLWSAGVSMTDIRKICAKSSFDEMTEKIEEQAAIDKACAKAWQDGARDALRKAGIEDPADKKGPAAKSSAVKDTASASAKNDGSEQKTAGSGKPSFNLGADDDKQLLELKEQNKSWKEIAKQMKKPQDVLKNRFKEIGGSEKNPVAQKESKKEQKESKSSKSQPLEADGTQGQNKLRNPVRNANGDVTDLLLLRPDEEFDEELIVAIANAMYDDGRDYHRRLTSRVVRRTGRHVSEKDVKRLLETACIVDSGEFMDLRLPLPLSIV